MSVSWIIKLYERLGVRLLCIRSGMFPPVRPSRFLQDPSFRMVSRSLDE